MVNFILEFLIAFIIIFLLNYFISYRKIKRFNRKNMPISLKYLTFKYSLDIVKIGYKRLYKVLIVNDSIIIALLFTITEFINNIYIRFITCFILMFPLLASSYYLIAKYYKNKED